jgi:hypothetical protein
MNFELKLLSQNWADNDLGNRNDLCSHGALYLRIGDNEVANEGDGDWTVSTSALIMLRSAISDYATDESAPMIHHCGLLMMMGCPISISWTVRHNENEVTVSELRKQPTVNSEDVISYLTGNETVSIKKATYVRQVLRFSNLVGDFLIGSPTRVIDDEYDRTEYSDFLDEFNSLRDKAREVLGHIT